MHIQITRLDGFVHDREVDDDTLSKLLAFMSEYGSISTITKIADTDTGNALWPEPSAALSKSGAK